MSVVLRCPSCGTTGIAPGECQACNDAQLQYFCTNHTPGLWLADRSCPRCRAGLVDAADRPPPFSSAREPKTVTTRLPARPSARPPASAPPALELPAEDVDERAPSLPPWQSLLSAFLRARYLPAPAAHRRTGLSVARGSRGCVMRLALIVLFLLLAMVVGLFLFGRALFQGLQPY